MKDSYSFDMDAAGLDAAYEKHYDAYCRIFDRCGLKYVAGGGALGRHGRQPVARIHGGHRRRRGLRRGVPALRLRGQPGEGRVARPRRPLAADPEGDLAPEKFHTPGRKTIAEVAEFTGLPETSQMKSLVMVADGKPVLVLVRGDHSLSETKFAGVVGRDAEVRPAHPEEIRERFGADAGFARAGRRARTCAFWPTRRSQGRRNMIAGANKDDYHLRHVTPGEDFTPEFHDLRQVADGRRVHQAAAGALELEKTVEIGHIFKLGYKYSESHGAARAERRRARKSRRSWAPTASASSAFCARPSSCTTTRTACRCRRRSRRSRW